MARKMKNWPKVRESDSFLLSEEQTTRRRCVVAIAELGRESGFQKKTSRDRIDFGHQTARHIQILDMHTHHQLVEHFLLM
jgi:hypothetical protein